jgi:hypothetical protein
MSLWATISVLSNFFKLFEFVIHDYVLHFVKLSPNQYGLTKFKSTVTNLVTLLDFVTLVLCGQPQAHVVYFDLSNAFDFVPHNMPLHKLSSFGFSDAYLSWFRSYLTNRHSQVRVSWYSLPIFQVASGVLRGSVLGPFLFNIFINDIFNSINYCKFLIFVEDSKFSAS